MTKFQHRFQNHNKIHAKQKPKKTVTKNYFVLKNEK